MNHPSHELTLGSLDLIGRMDQGANFRLVVTGDDATWGNPQSVTSTLKGLLRDGARVSLESWENREAFLRVVIMSGTGEGLAEGEAALFAELGKRNALTWTPSGGFSTPTVFDVEWSELDHDFKPVTEALGRVEYGIKLTCLPFARSVNPTLSEVMSTPPPPADPVIVTVDTCDSTAGWSASPSPIASTGGLVYNSTMAGARSEVKLYRAGTFPVDQTPYLVVEWSRQRPD